MINRDQDMPLYADISIDILNIFHGQFYSLEIPVSKWESFGVLPLWEAKAGQQLGMNPHLTTGLLSQVHSKELKIQKYPIPLNFHPKCNVGEVKLLGKRTTFYKNPSTQEADMM